MWYGINNELNKAIRGPEDMNADALGCLILIMTMVTQTTETETPLQITTANKTLIKMLTVNLVDIEATGWKETKHATHLRRLVGALRARKAPTTLKLLSWRKTNHTITGGLTTLLATGLTLQQAHNMDYNEEEENDPILLRSSGVKLTNLTQAMAYKIIRNRIKMKEREPTCIMLERTRASMSEILNEEPVDPFIWQSIRTKSLQP